jgi:hypothetical protein
MIHVSVHDFYISTISEIMMGSMKSLRCFADGSREKWQKIAEFNDVLRFVKLLEFPNSGVQAEACQIIFHLVSNCPKNRIEFWEQGAVDKLQRLLLSGNTLVLKDAEMALVELLNGCDSTSAMGHGHLEVFSKENLEAKKLVVQSFVKRLSCDFDIDSWIDLQRSAAQAVVKVSAVKSEGHIDVCSQWAADAICQLLQSPDAMVQMQAATTIVLFCHSPVHCLDAFRVAGCVPLLRGMLSSPSTAVQSTTVAIEMLRDCAQDLCMHAASNAHMRCVGGVEIVAITHHSGGGFAALDYTLQFHRNTFVADSMLSNGCFYFEVEILTFNFFEQFGVVTHGFEPCAGAGVGDDALSWGVCGRSLQKWHGGKRSVFGSRWSVGDTIGFALDMRIERAAIMSVSVNGSFAAPNGAAFKDISAQYLSPAFSGSCDRCRLNLGNRPFAHAPPDDGVYVSVHDFHRRKAETTSVPGGSQEKESTQHVKQCSIS